MKVWVENVFILFVFSKFSITSMLDIYSENSLKGEGEKYPGIISNDRTLNIVGKGIWEGEREAFSLPSSPSSFQNNTLNKGSVLWREV